MKSLEELKAIKEKAKANLDVRKDNDIAKRIVVGMATCGIAAGARPVLNAFTDEVAKRKLENVHISQTGCIGMCQYEPIVEVFVPGEEKVTYVKMTPDKARQVVAEHLVNSRPIKEYTIGEAE